MAKFFPLDLSKFKRVSSDNQTTTLRHEHGHEVKIAHGALSPKLRGNLAALPQHEEPKGKPSAARFKEAQGGEVRQSNPKLEESKKVPHYAEGGETDQEFYDSEADKLESSGDAKGANAIRGYPTPSPTPKPMAEGGDPAAPIQVDAVNGYDDATPPTPEAPQAPQVAPQQADMRRLYNQAVMVPTGKGQMAQPGKAFGPNGEAPQNFDSAAWNQAKGAYETEQAQRGQQQKEAAQQGAMDAKARQEAGLPPATPTQAANDALPPAQGQPSQPTSAQPTGQQGAGDPFGTQATMNAFQTGLGEAKAGLAGEARALGAQGAAEAATLEQDVQKRQDAQANYQDHFDKLDQERQNFQQDLINQHIDPGHYLASIGTVGKISTGIGLILGGMGGGLTHQENPALKFLQSQIDRDISAQQMELGKKENLLSANMRQFGNLKDATDMTRIMQNDIVAMQLKHAAAKAMDPLAKSRAMQAAGKIDMDSAQAQGQMAMRKTLLSGVNSGHVDPAKVVNLMLPPDQRAEGNKELKEAQTMVANRDAALAGFDKVAKLNTVGNRMMNPIQSAQQIKAITEPLIAELSKSTAGRFTEQDADMLRNLFSKMSSNTETNRVQRMALNNLLGKHIKSNNFPTLSTYGIDPGNWGRFGASGESRIPESAPITKK
jgi:hypothetical protein